MQAINDMEVLSIYKTALKNSKTLKLVLKTTIKSTVKMPQKLVKGTNGCF